YPTHPRRLRLQTHVRRNSSSFNDDAQLAAPRFVRRRSVMWLSWNSMQGDADIAKIGALVADPARARILLALGDGRALPASVLVGRTRPAFLAGLRLRLPSHRARRRGAPRVRDRL